MTIILYISAVISGFTLKKSKVCTAFIIFVMIALAASRYKSADLNNYMIEYAQASHSSGSFRYLGYTMLIKFFSTTGMSFALYMILFYLICFGLLLFALRFLTDSINPVLSLYLIYPYGLDVIQMKSLLSECIILVGLVFLFKNIEARRVDSHIFLKVLAVFALIAAIATLVHFSAVYYLMAGLLFIVLYEKPAYFKIILVLTITSTLIVLSGGITVILNYAAAIGILGDMNYLEQWSQRNGHFGFLIMVFLMVIVAFGAKCLLDEDRDNREKQIYYAFIYTMFFSIPLIMYDITFNRLLRVYLVLFYVIYSLSPSELLIPKNRLLGFGCVYGTVAYAFLVDLLPTFHQTLGAIFNFSTLFK